MGAGDGTRTRDSLLGRQMVTGSPPAYHEMALGVHSYDSIEIHAHLRQMVRGFSRQMVMDRYLEKVYVYFSQNARKADRLRLGDAASFRHHVL